MNMFMEKPSCIKELKRLASVISTDDGYSVACMNKVKQIINNDALSPTEQIIKLKEICKEHGKREK